jgi:hypothetical protein
MKISLRSTASSITTLLLLTSCGNNQTENKSTSRGSTQAEEIVPIDGSNIVGRYQAKFITLNPHVNGTIPGSANFFRKEDKIFAYVRLFAGGPKTWHMQHVYTGNRCPDSKDDLNGDGFIDIEEAEAVLGKILIPLDADISTQEAGRRFFPLADLSGYYHYERITNFERFLKDLQEVDKNPDDRYVKLPPGEGLQLIGKTFLVQGVPETVQLPDTVASLDRRKSFQTLPIVCGVFEKADTIPGEVYIPDEIPGPVAEVEEGQDRPADIENEDTQTEGGGDPTTTNESDDGDGPVSDGEGNRRIRTSNDGTRRPRISDPTTTRGRENPERTNEEQERNPEIEVPTEPQTNTTGEAQT